VDDDGSVGGSYDDIMATYTAALDAAGYSGQYDTFEVPYNDNGPDAASMAPYDLVIWLTGETWNAAYCVTLSSTDEGNLATYLDGGGSLILFAQDYLYDQYPTAGSFSPGQFPYDYLDLTSVVQDYWSVPYYNPDAHAFGSTGSPAAGTDFALMTPFGDTDLFVDWVYFNGDAIFEIDGDNNGSAEGPAANYYMARADNVLFSTIDLAGFVDGSSPSTKAEVLGAILDTFLGGGGEVDTVFFDDFESGTGNWAGDWGTDSTYAYSGTYSFTDSPYGDPPNASTIMSRMHVPADLSPYLGATLTFQYMHWIEQGFDYGYLDASLDGGVSWIELETYNDTVDSWTMEEVDFGAFVGESDVRIRFRLVTDPNYVEDGWYVDDVMITGSAEDHTPPLIVHDPPDDTVSVVGDLVVMAEIIDISGLTTDSMYYRFDEGSWYGVTHDSTSNGFYYYTIPGADAGTWVEYYFTAEDASPFNNYAVTETFLYIAGTVLYYDDGDPEYIATWLVNDELAVVFEPPPCTTLALVTLQYKFYRDTSYELDSVEVHVWDVDAGLPNQDVITPFNIWPANTPETPHAWTFLDVRDMNITFDGGEWFALGHRMLSDLPVNSIDSPGQFFHSYLAPGGAGWVDAGVDFFYRVVVDLIYPVQENTGAPVDRIFSLGQNLPNPTRGATTIQFALPAKSDVSLKVYDVNGRLVNTLFNGVKDAGSWNVDWNGKDHMGRTLPAGVYFYRLEAGEDTATRKLILAR
jgi:hypothetical protein